MIDALKFVQGAVAKKDYQPALTHFCISGGRIIGYNGTIALSSPIDIDIEAIPKAVPFIRAIENCAETIAVHMTKSGRISLKSGQFQAYIDCLDDGTLFSNVRPDGIEVALPGGVLDALRVLEPFIGVDASRPWATGILLKDMSAYATNNIVVIEYWIGVPLPYVVNIPAQAVAEILRVNIEPERMTLSDNSLTLHYPGDRWLRMNLLNPEWPDLTPILSSPFTLTPIPDGFFDAIDALAPFTTIGRVFFRGDRMTTSMGTDDGATVTIANLEHSDDCASGLGGGCDCPALMKMPIPQYGAYNYNYLSMLRGVAKYADFSPHPKPCGFTGDRLRGIIVGMVEQ